MKTFAVILSTLWLKLQLIQTQQVETPKPIVAIEMNAFEGMHRDLVYTVQFDYPLAGKECEYALQQHLPAAVYVGIDQLDDLKRLKKLNALYPKFVDIEMPTEKSQPFNVLLMGQPKVTETFKLPIHFRYHAPSKGNDKSKENKESDENKESKENEGNKESTYVTVEIAPPSLYMNCPDNDNDLNENNLQRTPHLSYCLEENTPEFIPEKENTNKPECLWKEINVDYKINSPLSAKIPVGNEKAFPLVLYGTIVLSWVVSLWTVFRTQGVPLYINDRLERQRTQQKKTN